MERGKKRVVDSQLERCPSGKDESFEQCGASVREAN